LSLPSSAVESFPWNAIEKDCRSARRENRVDLTNETIIKPYCFSMDRIAPIVLMA
jgi:hypothetical protein